MDWRYIYRELEKEGYVLALPTSKERREFREKVKKQHGIDYELSRTRAFYILGNGKSNSTDFFDNTELTDELNSRIGKLSMEVRSGDKSFQYCGYDYTRQLSPTEILGRRLSVGQLTLEFISSEMLNESVSMGVFVSWKDSRKSKRCYDLDKLPAVAP